MACVKEPVVVGRVAADHLGPLGGNDLLGSGLLRRVLETVFSLDRNQVFDGGLDVHVSRDRLFQQLLSLTPVQVTSWGLPSPLQEILIERGSPVEHGLNGDAVPGGS